MKDTKVIPKTKREEKADQALYMIDGKVFIGKDWALQNEIDEAKRKTEARACYRECRTCGTCANSRRGCAVPRTYDANAGRSVDCRGCEPFRFHDCTNGWMRDSRGNAEPFTPEAQKLFNEGGKPLI